MKLKVKILWSLFFLTTVFSVINALHPLMLFIPVVLLVLHSIWTLSFFKGMMFILTACFTGFIFEFIGLKYGTFFGGSYVYSLGGVKILSVPLSVIFYWGVFIYTGYCITNSFRIWLKKEKPSKRNEDVLWLLMLIIFDGLIVTAIDLFMDPLQVRAGSWTWIDGGPYFGIPVGNFIGWFWVTVVVTGLFRVYEYFRPTRWDKTIRSVFVIPVLGYGLLYFNFLIMAIGDNMISLAIVGSITMLPIVLSNLFLFVKSKGL